MKTIAQILESKGHEIISIRPKDSVLVALEGQGFTSRKSYCAFNGTAKAVQCGYHSSIWGIKQVGGKVT